MTWALALIKFYLPEYNSCKQWTFVAVSAKGFFFCLFFVFFPPGTRIIKSNSLGSQSVKWWTLVIFNEKAIDWASGESLHSKNGLRSRCVQSRFSHVLLCDPIDRSPPSFSVHGILQARILEWVAMPSSRVSALLDPEI